MSKTEIICQDQYGTLTCDSGKVLNIVSANYGRSSIASCFSWMLTWNCGSERSLEVVQSVCQHQPSCRVLASDLLFGDPCQGTSKYLEIEYNCQSAPTTNRRTMLPLPSDITVATSLFDNQDLVSTTYKSTPLTNWKSTSNSYNATTTATATPPTATAGKLSYEASSTPTMSLTSFKGSDISNAKGHVTLNSTHIASIACGAAVVLLIFLLAFILLKRKRKSHNKKSSQPVIEEKTNEIYEMSGNFYGESSRPIPVDQSHDVYSVLSKKKRHLTTSKTEPAREGAHPGIEQPQEMMVDNVLYGTT